MAPFDLSERHIYRTLF